MKTRSTKIIHLCSILALGLGGTTHSTLAEVASSAPEPAEWYQSLTAQDLSQVTAPQNILAVASLSDNSLEKGLSTYKQFNFDACREISVFRCFSPIDAAFTAKLNPQISFLGLKGLWNFPSVDSVILPLEKVTLYLKQPKLKVNLPISSADYSKANAQLLTDRILTGLGYDGVILATKGDYLLVGSVQSKLQKASKQGLVVGDSHAKWSLVRTKQAGVGLISLVSSSGGLGVFQLLLSSSTSQQSVPVGTKIMLESASTPKR